MSDLKKTAEAYLQMVSEKKEVVCEKCGEVHEGSCMDEKKELDPVNDAENDKKFKDRKDKDIDNDGDVDSSDEFLHKKRAATDDAIDGGKKPAKNVKEEKDEEEEPKKKMPPKKDGDADEGETEAEKEDDDAEAVEADGEGDAEKPVKKKKKTDENPKTSDSTAEISKIESVNAREAFIAMWSEIEEAVRSNQKKGATEPEKIDSKASGKEKEFVAKHPVDAKDHDELEKVEEPKERTVKKEMAEFEVIRALLSGKPTGE